MSDSVRLRRSHRVEKKQKKADDKIDNNNKKIIFNIPSEYNSYYIRMAAYLFAFGFFYIATTYSSKHNYDANAGKRKSVKLKNVSDVCCEQIVQISIITLTVVVASW